MAVVRVRAEAAGATVVIHRNPVCSCSQSDHISIDSRLEHVQGVSNAISVPIYTENTQHG